MDYETYDIEEGMVLDNSGEKAKHWVQRGGDTELVERPVLYYKVEDINIYYDAVPGGVEEGMVDISLGVYLPAGSHWTTDRIDLEDLSALIDQGATPYEGDVDDLIDQYQEKAEGHY